MAESHVCFSRLVVILFSLFLIASNDVNALKDGICKKFSSTFSGQCYVSAHCEATCVKEGSPSGECEWQGVHWGYVCMCQYFC
nr:defensin-like protein AX2 [Nicotiana tomentosiformis]